ncbi:mitogen-activated protein kinase kinase kinase 18-like protein [Tanacetum coccineum]
MEWTRGDVLGRGSSATVSAATSTSGDIFAVKSVEFSQAESLQMEQHFLSKLHSPYVVSYKGCDITRESNKMVYNVFIEHMSYGSIMDLVKSRNGEGLTNFEVAKYTRDIVQGLVYLHSSGVVHCDIKGHNVLVNENGAKIGDLGCAKWADQTSPIRGTPMFMAPEVARGDEQGFPADIWALGCTVIEMVTGGSPWQNVSDPVSILYRIAFSGHTPEIPSEISGLARDFISKCLIRDPRQRWTAKDLLNHPYIQQFDENSSTTTCEKIITSSPTSILDQDIWNSTSQSLSPSSCELVQSISSLRQRVQKLANMSEKPKWDCGENEWFTIRN